MSRRHGGRARRPSADRFRPGSRPGTISWTSIFCRTGILSGPARWTVPLVAAALAVTLLPRPAAGQPQFARDAFADSVARQLYTGAQEGWSTLDASIVRYTARIDQRIAAALRTPLRDRVLYHNETAVRAFWERDFDPVVQVLGSRGAVSGA